MTISHLNKVSAIWHKCFHVAFDPVYASLSLIEVMKQWGLVKAIYICATAIETCIDS